MSEWHLIIKTSYKPIVICGESDTIKKIILIRNSLKEASDLLNFTELANNRFKEKLKQSFSRYFNGYEEDFKSIKIYLKRYTELEKRVLKIVKNIPFGILLSYKDVAVKVKNKNYARFVGNVMAKNRLPIIIPCHRVIKSDGSLGGFGAGLGWKRFLINIEKRTTKTRK